MRRLKFAAVEVAAQQPPVQRVQFQETAVLEPHPQLAAAALHTPVAALAAHITRERQEPAVLAAVETVKVVAAQQAAEPLEPLILAVAVAARTLLQIRLLLAAPASSS